jgi:hypothetical protein
VIRGRGGALTATVVVLAAITWSLRARAALDPSGRPLRVVLFTVTSDDPLAGRIDAELKALGFDVSRAAIAPEIDIEALVSRVLGAGARAAVVADGHRTDVWIAEDGTARVALRQELEVDETSGLQSVLALRTVEFLRISMGVGAPPVAPLPPPPAVVAPVPPPRPIRSGWLAVDASSGVLTSVGRVGPLAIAGANLRAGLGGLFGIELFGYAPLTNGTLSDGADQIRTSVWMAGGGLLVAPPSEGTWAWEAAVGTMAFILRSTGIAGSATIGEDQGVGLAVYGHGAVRLRLASRWSLRIDVMGGGSLRRPVLVFADGDTARWGTAFAATLGGAEMRF